MSNGVTVLFALLALNIIQIHGELSFATVRIAVVSEYLCHLRAQYAIQSPDICIG